MKLGSLFSGVEGFGLGFERAGFEVVWQVEREPFCIAVLKKHFPNVERYYEIKDCGHGRKHKLRAVDIVTAGFPCQDLSVAGKRAGLAGTRSGLFWELTRILGELRPPWIVIENVPGLFSSSDGEDFATVIRELGNIGYGLAWRVLDSQYFGVAQRRRRVFIVGCFGKPCPAEVLFESEGSEGDFAESRETRPELAFEVAASLRGVGGGPRGFTLDAEQGLAVTCLESGQANASIGHGIVPNLTCLHKAPIINIQDVRGHRDKKQNGIGISSGEPCYTLDGTSQHAVAFAENQRGEIRTSNISPQLSCSGGKPGSGYSAVAFTLPSEHRGIGNGHNTNYICNALTTFSGGLDDGDAQGNHIGAASLGSNGTWGFRYDFESTGAFISATVDPNGVRDFAGLPEGLDSARYRALGNAVTANVAFWIAKRIKESAKKNI